MSEENKELKTEQLEQQLAEAAKNPDLHSPADIAAAFFMMQGPKLARNLEKMSVKQLRRMIMYVASFPLNDKTFKPKTDKEASAAYTFNEMTFNRAIMQLQAEYDKASKTSQKEIDNTEVVSDNNVNNSLVKEKDLNNV